MNNRWLLSSLIGALVLAACAPTPAPPPSAGPGLDPTDFIRTRVAVILTETAGQVTAAPPTATPPPPTPPAAPSAAVTATPTRPATATPVPVPTLDLASFPRPPAAFGGDAHFWFERPVGAGGNVFPASNYRYGSTANHQLETHHGVEFANPPGMALVAVAPGTIYYAGNDAEREFGAHLNFYGNLVILQLQSPWLGQPVFALYGHLDTITVAAGQAVAAGDPLGTVGATGVALGPHLHLEVRVGDPDSYWTSRNPELWLAPGAGFGAVAVRVTNAHNQYLPGQRVTFRCADGAERFLDTYWDPGVNPDDLYGENAAMNDVPAGYCQFGVTVEGQALTQTLTLQPGVVNFVWLKP